MGKSTPFPEDSASESDFDGLYEELRRLAKRRLDELPPGQTLQPTALVHEAWLRLEGRESPLPPGRRSLMFLVVRAMRDLLVEDARRKGALKRARIDSRIPLESVATSTELEGDGVLAVDEALAALEGENSELAQLVGLRYFAGLTVPEVSEFLGVSVSTVERQWAYARAWLRRYMDNASSE